MSQISIGVYSDSYPDERMILQKIPNACYVQVHNRRENELRALRYLGRRIPGLKDTDYYAQRVHFTLDARFQPDVDVIHTFNRVCLRDNNRWVATFEKTFPEYFSRETKLPIKLLKQQVPLLLSDQCAALLPMSRWARDYEKWLLKLIATEEEKKAIESKMTVLYPPQQVLLEEDEIRQKYRKLDTVRILFVGGQIKRKGGIELLYALKSLDREFHNFKAVVIGDLDNEYANFCLTQSEKQDIKELISGASWLEYHRKMSNQEILRYAREAHVGVLPTMGDTFGFSVLEMQACGCPVITTDRQTMKEINTDDCGWLLHVPDGILDSGDDFAHYSKEVVNELSYAIRKELIAVLQPILSHPESLEQRALNAQKRIRLCHDPIEYGEKLLQVYQRA